MSSAQHCNWLVSHVYRSVEPTQPRFLCMYSPAPTWLHCGGETRPVGGWGEEQDHHTLAQGCRLHTAQHTHIRYASKNVIKTVRSVCVARQRFPKNSVKRSVPFHGPFRYDGLPLQGFLATDADSINFAKNLVIPCPVAFIPSCRNFRDISPDLRPWRWWYITTCFV